MGEMCDFKAEYYPGAWASPYGKNGKKKARKDVYISMNAREYAQYKAIGGAVRWIDMSDGTLIIFTRGEYRNQLLKGVDKIPGITETVFETDGISAFEKVAQAAQPTTKTFIQERAQLEQEWCELQQLKQAYKPQPTRKALSDAELCVLLLGIDCETKRLPPGFKKFARAVEAAHGIGAQE